MKSAIILLSAAFAAGCANTGQAVQNTANAPAATPQKTEKIESVAAHTTENQPPKPSNTAPTNTAGQSKWTQSGDAIDTTALDSAIMSAEKAVSGKSADAAAKKALGTAYFKRAVALTDARQYASALGDYRRTLKYDPANAEAKEWIDRIIMIYTSINRSYPGEGEEPPPIPFKKP